jgi:tetraacyldisaccharide 4'-kinase
VKAITHYWQSINFVSISLLPISLLFCLLAMFRRLLYRVSLLKSSHSKIPLIVVGNIYIGGNGKTPFVIELVKQLQQAGYTPAIVSRGYGALNEQECDLEWPRKVNLKQPPAFFGDEPYLIHYATQCPVIIDPQRSRAVDSIEQAGHCDVIISDDGLQHYAMSRFIEINITDAQRLYGNGFCLPAGPLRESTKRLKSVDYIVYNISQTSTDYTPRDFPEKSFLMSYKLQELIPVSTALQDIAQPITLAILKGKTIHAVAGIGDPKRFFKQLIKLGANVIAHSFDDHHRYQANELVFGDDHLIIMTEKDAVKCQSFSLPNAWYLPIKADLDNLLVEQIVQKLRQF